jgi:recombination protein RecA
VSPGGKGEGNKKRIQETVARSQERAARLSSDGAAFDGVDLDAAIAAVVGIVNQKHGEGSLSVLNAPGSYAEITHVIPTGIPALDEMFGTTSTLTGEMGLPLGKLITVEGPESSGKTTLCKALAALGQKRGVIPTIHDGEHAGVLDFDARLGLDLSRALGFQPETLEDSFSIMSTTIQGFQARGIKSLQILDSVASIPCAEEASLGFDEAARLGSRARFLSQNLPKLLKVLHDKSPVGLIFVNQVREKIGALQWQKQTYSTGGRALRHYAHVRVELAATGQIKRGDVVIGIKTTARAIKNKLANPYKKADLQILFDPPQVLGADQKPTRTPL